MNLPFTSIALNFDGSWAFAWAPVAGATQYRIVYQNTLLAIVTTPAYTYNLPNTGSTPPAIEVVANNARAISEYNPGRLILQWYGLTPAIANEDIQYYFIEQYVNGGWVQVATVAETGQWVYSVTTPVQPDNVVAEFRISAVGSIGQVSGYLIYETLVVRPPDPPVVAVGYDNGTGQVVIST